MVTHSACKPWSALSFLLNLFLNSAFSWDRPKIFISCLIPTHQVFLEHPHCLVSVISIVSVISTSSVHLLLNVQIIILIWLFTILLVSIPIIFWALQFSSFLSVSTHNHICIWSLSFQFYLTLPRSLLSFTSHCHIADKCSYNLYTVSQN